MTWLMVMMTLTCRDLVVEEKVLARAVRIQKRWKARCVGAKCSKHDTALTDHRARQEARRLAWQQQECGGPEGDT